MDKELIQKIRKNGIWIPVCLAVIVIVIIVVDMHFLQRKAIETVAYEQARSRLSLIESFRSLYTSEVVSKITKHGFNASHDYHYKEKDIPLPATLSIEIGSKDNHKIRLYSAFPFPWRVGKDGGPQDSFEKEALIFLNDKPDEEYFREDIQDGKKVFRLAIADKLRSACVSCHNTHPQTPKSDWKTGDVRGVLSSVVSLEQVKIKLVTHMRESLFRYVGAILFSLLILVQVLWWLGRKGHDD